MEDLQLNVEDAENRAEWRRRTGVADPSPEGSTAWRRERERESWKLCSAVIFLSEFFSFLCTLSTSWLMLLSWLGTWRPMESGIHRVPQNGPAKSRNPRNPWNPPKFTKSSVFNRPIVSETYLNQQRQPLTSSDQRTLTVDDIGVASSLNFSILIECTLLNACEICECVDFVSSTVFRRIRQFRGCLRWI